MAKSKSKLSSEDIKKYLFWSLVPIAILLVWGVFFVAHSKAISDYENRLKELDDTKGAIGQLRGNSDHPNTGSIEDAKLKEQALRKVVLAAWEEMYDAQKQNCTWSNQLDSRFIEIVKPLKWMDPIPKAEVRSFSGVEIREWYSMYIGEQIPEFLNKAQRRTVKVRVIDPNTGVWKKDANGEIIYFPIDPYVADPERMILENANLISSGTGMDGSSGMGMGGGGMRGSGAGGGGGFTSFSTTAGGSMGGTGGGMSGDSGGFDMGTASVMAQSVNTTVESIFDDDNQRITGVVDWPNPEIFSIVTWSQRPPFSPEIWYAQEEVWVYESLINVVQKVNKSVNATGPHNAAIKRIQAMLIGRNAAGIVRAPDILKPLSSASGATGMTDMMDSSSSSGSSSDMSSSSDGTGMAAAPVTEEEVKAYLTKYRYVGLDMKPLSDTDPAPYAEFNMMPVCLELIVDQRKIPDILVECANSTMPIDIKLVRYNPANAQTGLVQSSVAVAGMDGTTGDSSMSGSSSSMSGGAGRGAAAGRGQAGTDGGMSAAADALSGFEVGGKMGAYGSDAVMIQIIGIIYIYNEPSPDLLATGAVAQASGIEGGVVVDDLDQSTAVDDDTSTMPFVPTTEDIVDEDETVIDPADDSE